MAIRIRHSTLSQKTQSALTGIISKNEWNAAHSIDPIQEYDSVNNEVNIIYSTTVGHDHNGSNSKTAARVIAVQDSGSTSNYRIASQKPIDFQIPILDSGGYLNVCRITAGASVTGMRFYDFGGLISKASFEYNFNSAHVKIANVIGTNYITLTDVGDVVLGPKTGFGAYNICKLSALRNTTVTGAGTGNFVNLHFQDSTGAIESTIRHQFNTTATADYLELLNPVGNFIRLIADGNIVLNSATVSGKVYYTKSGVAYTANDELITRAHNHDGSNSSVAARVIAVQNALNTADYRPASTQASANQIPIIDADGWLRIRRTGTNAYHGIILQDTGNVDKTLLFYNFTNNIACWRFGNGSPSPEIQMTTNHIFAYVPSGTLYSTANDFQFNINSGSTGKAYYTKNASPSTGREIAVKDDLIGLTVIKDTELLNGSFEYGGTSGSVAPHNWSIEVLQNGSWSFDTTTNWSTRGIKGSQILGTNNYGIYLYSDYMQYDNRKGLMCAFSLKCSAVNVGVDAIILYYDRNFVYITHSTIYGNASSNPTTWRRVSNSQPLPAVGNACFCRVRFLLGTNGGTLTGDASIDSVVLKPWENSHYMVGPSFGSCGGEDYSYWTIGNNYVWIPENATYAFAYFEVGGGYYGQGGIMIDGVLLNDSFYKAAGIHYGSLRDTPKNKWCTIQAYFLIDDWAYSSAREPHLIVI